MKIRNIRCLLGNVGNRNIIFLETRTDEGITGLGEAFGPGPDLAVVETVEYLKEWLVGKDPRNIEGLWATMYQGLRFPPGAVALAAISGIEHTLWDISAKALGVPVYRLLGGRVRDRIRVYQGVPVTTPEETAELAFQLVDKYGYTALKMRPYPPQMDSMPWNDVVRAGIQNVEAVRAAIGRDADIALEAHGKIFEPARALELTNAMLPLRPFFLEEPIRPENLSVLATLRRKMRVPVATGEAVYTRYGFNRLLQLEAADIIQPDIGLCGGLLEMRKISALAEAHDVTVAPHNPRGPIATAVNLHFAATVCNFLILEFAPQDVGTKREFIKEPWVPQGGYLSLPTSPGWGVELDEEGIGRHPYKPWRRGTPHRHDGSPGFL
jgi:galactonate dehydratase